MKKEIKLNPQSVQNAKPYVINAVVDVPFGEPNIKSLTPLKHIRVVLYLSDGNQFERHFDFFYSKMPLDSYIELAVSLFNQCLDDSVDKAK